VGCGTRFQFCRPGVAPRAVDTSEPQLCKKLSCAALVHYRQTRIRYKPTAKQQRRHLSTMAYRTTCTTSVTASLIVAGVECVDVLDARAVHCQIRRCHGMLKSIGQRSTSSAFARQPGSNHAPHSPRHGAGYTGSLTMSGMVCGFARGWATNRPDRQTQPDDDRRRVVLARITGVRIRAPRSSSAPQADSWESGSAG
jgi:hypothetical protein